MKKVYNLGAWTLVLWMSLKLQSCPGNPGIALNYVIIASLKSETMGKLINRIPGSLLLISSLPGKAFRKLVDITRLAERFNKLYQSRAW